MTDPRWDVTQVVGLEVTHGDAWVRLGARTRTERAMLANAAEKLGALAAWRPRVVPAVLAQTEDALTLERVIGEPGDERTWLWGACDLLAALQFTGIKHGDLTTKNLVHDGGRPWAIDFQEAVWLRDGIVTKRPESDAAILWEAGIALTGDTDRRLRRWQALRPHLAAARLIDLGCAGGQFCRLAEVDSPATTILGMDHDPQHAPTWRAQLQRSSARIGDLWTIDPAWCAGADVLLLSVWDHLAAAADRPRATAWLDAVVRASAQTFFEPHYCGDGPGALFIDDRHTANYLTALGLQAEALVTVPVAGRPAARTLWRVWAAA